MSGDKLDEILEQIFSCETMDTRNIEDFNIPDLDFEIKKFESNLALCRNINKQRRVFRGRLLTAACIIAFSIALSFIYEVPPVSALKASVIDTIIKIKDDSITVKHSYRPNTESRTDRPPDNDDEPEIEIINMSIDEARKLLPFHLVVPGYLPEGYSFQRLEYFDFPENTSNAAVNITYTNGSKGFLLIRENYITGEFASSHGYNKTEQTKVRNINVLGAEAVLISSPEGCSASWFKDRVEFDITGTMPEEEFIKLLEGLN